MALPAAGDPMNSPGDVPSPIRGPFSRWPRAADASLALIVLLMTLFSGEFQDPDAAQGFTVQFQSALPVFAYLVAVIGSGALYWRRRVPLAVLGAAIVGSAIWLGFGYSPDPFISWPFALYAVGRYTEDDRWSYGAVGLSTVLVTGGVLLDDASAAQLPLVLLVVFLPWYVGRRVRIRGTYLDVLRERAQYLEREQEAVAHRALADERTRIARELHDVVAHRVSLMTVQAGAAKTVAADDPDSALRSMEAVEQAGRQALGELRHLLGVLRPDSPTEDLGPQPGIGDIPRLVNEVRQAGVDVKVSIDNMPANLPAHVDLSAFRIIQEALTNVLKHAGPDAAAQVRMSAADEAVTIEVVDTGHGANGVTVHPPSGHGIVGMKERALSLGGSLQAGPIPGGGFRVVASLPMGGDGT